MTAPAVAASDVAGIAAQVWLSLSGEPALPSGAAPRPMPADALRSWVSIEGPWRGHLLLVCGRETAGEMAAAVVGTGPDGVAPEDVDDVLGELANVVGGAVKAMIPGSAALSLPTVGAAAAAGPPGDPALRVDLVWRGRPVEVTLLALDPSPPRQGSPPAPTPPPVAPATAPVPAPTAASAAARGERP